MKMDVNCQIGGMKLLEKKFKQVEYNNKKIYGINNIDSEQLSETSEFPIGSITKLFTIVSLLLLHQNKQLNIYENIGKYIKNEHIKNLKIIDIMNHKSGLINNYDDMIYGSSKIKYESATQVYHKYNNNKLLNEKLKDVYAYSNIGFNILGYLIEQITGIKYSDFVKKNILIPLKMDNTGIEDCNITLYNKKLKKLTKYEKWERTFASSAGELKSCVKDLIKFSKFVKLLDKQTLDILKELYIYRKKNDENIINHGGNISGGDGMLRIFYDNNYKVKDIYISLKTA
jgi:CubicO group peptidase (beta-lactamase class C family)